jgi:hypothetical protein
LALFWLDLREVMKSKKPLAYTLSTHRGKCALVFVLFALPELILQGMQALAFTGPKLFFITAVIFFCNVIVAAFFVKQVKKTVVQIGAKTKAASAQTSGARDTISGETGDTASSSSTRQAIARNRKFMRHMAKWMAVFSWFVLLQTLGVMMLPFIRNSFVGLFLFVLFATTSRIGMSAAKVWSLKPPRDKVKKACVLANAHEQPTPLPSSMTSSVQDRSQWN